MNLIEAGQRLNRDFGLDIFSKFLSFNKNGQKVRYKDDSKTSSEVIYFNKGATPLLKSFNESETGYTSLSPLSLYMQQTGLSFAEAVKELATEYHITLDSLDSPQSKPYDTIPISFWEKHKKYEHKAKEFLAYYHIDAELNYGLETLNKYRVTGDEYGRTLYWLFDANEEIRGVQVIEYNNLFKRNKASFPFYLHKKAFPNLEFKMCFFGEHLIKTSEVVGICESPKNAIICEIMLRMGYFEDISFVAGLGAASLKQDYLYRVLRGKEVLLLPDHDIEGRLNMGLLPSIVWKNTKFSKQFVDELKAYIYEAACEVYTSLYDDWHKGSFNMFDYEHIFLEQLCGEYDRIKHHVFHGNIEFKFSGALQNCLNLGIKTNIFDLSPELWDKSDIADAFTAKYSPNAATNKIIF